MYFLHTRACAQNIRQLMYSELYWTGRWNLQLPPKDRLGKKKHIPPEARSWKQRWKMGMKRGPDRQKQDWTTAKYKHPSEQSVRTSDACSTYPPSNLLQCSCNDRKKAHQLLSTRNPSNNTGTTLFTFCPWPVFSCTYSPVHPAHTYLVHASPCRRLRYNTTEQGSSSQRRVFGECCFADIEEEAMGMNPTVQALNERTARDSCAVQT